MAVFGATLAPGTPVVLFRTLILRGGTDSEQGRQYDVAPDGRFLINTVLDEAAAPITLLAELESEASEVAAWSRRARTCTPRATWLASPGCGARFANNWAILVA